MADTIVPGPGWDTVLGRLAGDTVMVVGALDRGKSHLTRYLLRQAMVRAALVSADVGQPSLGPPACLAATVRRPWRTPDTLWFVGETSPARHLLPTVVGTARLAAWARAGGAELVVIDTGGLVQGPLARLLKGQKASAAAVTDVVAIERQDDELAPLLALLEGIARVHRVRPAPAARQRDRDERRAYREARYRAHLRGAVTVRLPLRRLIGADWSVGAAAATPSPGTLVGLVDRRGFCAAIGVVQAIRAGALEIRTRSPKPPPGTRVQAGHFALGPGGVELRSPLVSRPRGAL